MHEQGLIDSLVRRITAVMLEQRGSKVVSASVRVGALAHISADHLREHFEHTVRGTILEGAHLDVEVATDIGAPDAQDIVLTSVAVETEE